ncbi:E3 UBIQUITIN PROTEIN LIGASE DRIP1 [Salix purpurea]|uniref:E3 UBIQUITIN PROTEIN LIGASE DRIP1 n=1 Tax=Salix purpurea TaxID=77065 RepID=A0A9Q0WVX1_SALPP|nr:E3 UBIQUITIN PROTEIN LIGASE DRIP1 [Salix purpurea]
MSLRDQWNQKGCAGFVEKRQLLMTFQAFHPQQCCTLLLQSKKEEVAPVWFSLLASEEQEGDAPLPQIPSSYLRLKDGNVPVSFIQKYLMKKLDLNSEAEVEIRCMGRPVIPTLLLRNLVDQWLQTAPKPEQVPVSAGCSAKDFVMVLAYARKVPNP